MFLKEFLKTYRNLVIIPVFSPYLRLGVGARKQKISIKQKLLMVKAFNYNFSLTKT